jgi:hypothetical protein
MIWSPDPPMKVQLRTPSRIRRIWRVRWQEATDGWGKHQGERLWGHSKTTTFNSEKEYKERVAHIFKHDGLRLLGAWTAEVSEWEKIEFPELQHQAMLHG